MDRDEDRSQARRMSQAATPFAIGDKVIYQADSGFEAAGRIRSFLDGWPAIVFSDSSSHACPPSRVRHAECAPKPSAVCMPRRRC